MLARLRCACSRCCLSIPPMHLLLHSRHMERETERSEGCRNAAIAECGGRRDGGVSTGGKKTTTTQSPAQRSQRSQRSLTCKAALGPKGAGDRNEMHTLHPLPCVRTPTARSHPPTHIRRTPPSACCCSCLAWPASLETPEVRQRDTCEEACQHVQRAQLEFVGSPSFVP